MRVEGEGTGEGYVGTGEGHMGTVDGYVGTGAVEAP